VKIAGINVTKKADNSEHKLLAIWAADCAEHVLPLFEDHYPQDDRPRKAIEAARAWVLGNLKMTEARKFAFAAHAAARNATRPESIAAARSAGHAAATAHVPGHAKHAAAYAAKSTSDPKIEIEWQLQKLPRELSVPGLS
jgi:hypothetical protein